MLITTCKNIWTIYFIYKKILYIERLNVNKVMISKLTGRTLNISTRETSGCGRSLSKQYNKSNQKLSCFATSDLLTLHRAAQNFVFITLQALILNGTISLLNKEMNHISLSTWIQQHAVKTLDNCTLHVFKLWKVKVNIAIKYKIICQNFSSF